MSGSSDCDQPSNDGNPTPAKKQKTDDVPVSVSSSIPFVTSVPVLSTTTGTTNIQPGALSFTISNGALQLKPVSVSENATPIGIQQTSNALPGTVAMVKGVSLTPGQLKIPNPSPLQQIRTTAFNVAQNTATTITVRPGMAFVARPGFPVQALQTAVQQAQQPKLVKGQGQSAQVQIQPQIQINPQGAVIQTSKVVQGHMALGQVSLTQFTQGNPTSVSQTVPQSTVHFQHKLQPQLVTKILPNVTQIQSQPLQVKQLTKTQQMQFTQAKGVTQIPLVVTQLSQNSQQTSAPKVTTTLTQSQAPVMQTWTLTPIPHGLTKGQDISKQVNLNPMFTVNPVQAKIQQQGSNLPKVISPVSPQVKPPVFSQIKPQTEIQIKAQVIPEVKQLGSAAQIKLSSSTPVKVHDHISVKPINTVPKLNTELNDKIIITASMKPQTDHTENIIKSTSATSSVSVNESKENNKAQDSGEKLTLGVSSAIPTVVFDANSLSSEKSEKKQVIVKKEERKDSVTKETSLSGGSDKGIVKAGTDDKNISDAESNKGDNLKDSTQKLKEGVIKNDIARSSDDSVDEKKLPVKTENLEMKMEISDESTPDIKTNETSVVVKQDMNVQPKTEKSSVRETEKEEVNEVETSKEIKEESDKKEDSVTGDFDAVGAMNWENGIGTLEGSDLKFKMNEFGVLEVVTDDLECAETLNLSSDSDDNKPKESGDAKSVDGAIMKPSNSTNATPSSDGDKKDEVCQCETCGEYGFSSEFCKNGRFCSQACLGVYTSKHMRGMKRQTIMSKMMLGLKKKKKKLMEDAINEFKSTPGRKKSFDWHKYLEEEKAIAAPDKLFKEAFPSQKNGFKVGMRMEGIDPRHQSLYCVLSVAEVNGYRIRLHFDGYSECYDFWTNADSTFIFPVGFCEKNGKTLQPPKGFNLESFNWTNYLKLARAVAAPKHIFSNQPVQPVTPSAFRAGCKIEAVDKKNNSLICVATVIDTMGDKVLVHFDGWEDTYDYWCDITSPNIHHVNWCFENGLQLSPPNDWKEGSMFSWESFLSKRKASAVPSRAFKPRLPVGFEVGMKIEVVDKRNPILIRVATITDTMNHLIKIHFDGWSDVYDYWLDDDCPDLHPPGWCSKTGHQLTPPVDPSDLVVAPGQSGCPTPGCKGIGHIKGAKYIGHHSHFGCPYSSANMNKETTLQDRLGSTRAEECSQMPSPSPTGTSSVKIFKQMEQPSSPDVKNQKSATIGDAPVGRPKLSSGSSSNQNQQRNTPSPTPTPPPTPPSKTKVVNGDVPKLRTKSTRGRKPRSYYLNMGDRVPKHIANKIHKEKEKEKDKHNLHNGIHQSVFMSAMIPNPNKDLPLCWEQHSKLLPGVDRVGGNDVTKWSIDQVTNFVKSLPGCEEHAKVFKDEQIDGEAFLLMTQTDIVKIMNIKLGPALKIYNSILMFKNSIEV